MKLMTPQQIACLNHLLQTGAQKAILMEIAPEYQILAAKICGIFTAAIAITLSQLETPDRKLDDHRN